MGSWDLPWISLAALLLLTPCFDVKVPLGGLAANTGAALLLLTGALCLLSVFRGRRSLPLTPPVLLALALGAWIILTGMFAYHPNTPRRVLALGLFLLAFLSGVILVRSPRDLRRLAALVPWSVAGAGITATVLRGTASIGGRAAGAFGNPNSLGVFFAATLPLVLHRFLEARGGRSRLVHAGVLAIAFYGLWISGSRGALVGTLAGCSIVLFHSFRRALLIALTLGALLVLVEAHLESAHGLAQVPSALAVAPEVFEVSKVWLAQNGFLEAEFHQAPWIAPHVLQDFPQTLGARMMIWYQAFWAGMAHPVLGIGPGASYFSGIPFDSKTFANCFNIYLAFLVEFGLVGFFLHLAWLQAIWAEVLQGILRSREVRGPLLGVAAGVLAFLVHGMVEDIYFGIYANWVVGLLLGVAARSRDVAEAGAGAPPLEWIPAGVA